MKTVKFCDDALIYFQTWTFLLYSNPWASGCAHLCKTCGGMSQARKNPQTDLQNCLLGTCSGHKTWVSARCCKSYEKLSPRIHVAAEYMDKITGKHREFEVTATKCRSIVNPQLQQNKPPKSLLLDVWTRSGKSVVTSLLIITKDPLKSVTMSHKCVDQWKLPHVH